MKTITFHSYLLTNKYSNSTCKMYEYVVNKYLRLNSNPSKLSFKEITSYLSALYSINGNHFSSVLVLSGIKKYYDYLLFLGKITIHPIKHFSIKGKATKILGISLFTPTELGSLLNRPERYPILKLRNQVLMSLLIYQGLSSNELCNICLNDIDFDLERIRVKGNRIVNSRLINLMPSQVELFERYLKECRLKLTNENVSNFLIGKTGNVISVDEINYLVETFKFLFPSKTLNPKTIRQSVIYNWINFYKLPLEDVQLLAGHKRISSTLKYQMPNMQLFASLINKYSPI
ncbi:MAG: integrase [Bacteroidetes bacterium B1(2017)]|nr:MAG: integrase [Bacteroidetes bacterium B1(2017)]